MEAVSGDGWHGVEPRYSSDKLSAGNKEPEWAAVWTAIITA